MSAEWVQYQQVQCSIVYMQQNHNNDIAVNQTDGSLCGERSC